MSEISNMSIGEYRSRSNLTARVPVYQRDKRPSPIANPNISKDNVCASILSSHMWPMFRELIDTAPFTTLVDMLHDPYCPCVGLLPSALDTARNYVYREFKKRWTNKEHYLFDIIETYFFPELGTHCEACGKPDTLIYHHWVEDDGTKGDAYICHSCNKVLMPRVFGLTESHHLPSWDIQVAYIKNRLNNK